MRVYILDQNNTLVLNGKVFVLARVKRGTANNVCSLCSLKYLCFEKHTDSKLFHLCMKPDMDGRWFFLDCNDLSESDKRNILWNIEKCLDIDF